MLQVSRRNWQTPGHSKPAVPARPMEDCLRRCAKRFTDFVQRRVDANMTTMREWYECRSLNDVLALQQRWVQSAVEQYVDQGNRIMETCRLAAADLTEAAQPAAEAEKAATERKPAAHRQAEQHLKQAA